MLTTDLCSLPVSEAIGHSLEKISEVKRNISIVKNNYATSKEESFNANNLLMEREESLKSSILPKYTKEDLDRRIILLKKINEIYRAYKSVSSLMSNEMPAMTDTNSNSFRTNPWFKSLTCGAIFILVLLTGILTGQDSYFSALISLLLSVGVWGFITYARVVNGSSRISDINERWDNEIKDYVNDIRDLFDELGLTLHNLNQVEDILEETEKENLISINQIEEYEKTIRIFTHAKEQCEEKESLVKYNKRVFEEAEAEEKNVEESWKQWLTENRLSLSLTPAAMTRYQQQIETGMVELKSARDKTSRYKAVKKDINEYIDLVKPIADKYSELYEMEDPKSLVAVADRLFAILQESKTHSEIKQGHLRTINKSKKDLAKRQRELLDANRALESLLKTSGANDEEEYRQMAKDTEDTRGLKRDKSLLDQILRKKSGVGKELLLFKQDLSETSYDAILFDRNETKSECDGEQSRLLGLNEQKGRVSAAISQLFKEDKLSELRASRSELVEQLSEDVRNWAKFKLADAMLKRGMEKYERESQPMVIRNAGQFFRDMT